MKFTVVCVCLNALDFVKTTLESMVAQSYSDVELIFVDGMSEDGTYEYLKAFEEKGLINLIHEKDSGIYDAMNKAVSIAMGDYIYFLGAGDYFYADDVLEKIADRILKEEKNNLPVVICGNFESVKEEGCKVFDFYHHPNFSGFRRACGFPTSHQAFMIRTDIMKEHPFDTSYVYQADQEVLAYCLKNYPEQQLLINEIIARVDANGFSSKASRKKMQNESDWINKRYNSFWYYFIYIPKSILRTVIINRTLGGQNE